MTGTRQRSSWSIARFPQEGMLIFTVLLWAGYFLVIVAITIGIAIFGSVTASVWEKASALPRWFALGIGIWLTGVYLRLHVAHGKTRREFMRQTSVFTVVFAALLAALITVGYLLERAVYAIGGWPQTIDAEHFSGAAGDLGPMLLSYFVVFLGWTTGGALVAAGYRRLDGLGLLLTIPVALVVLVGLTEFALPARDFAPLRLLDIDLTVSLPVATAVGLASFLAGLAGTWALTRDVPLSREAV